MKTQTDVTAAASLATKEAEDAFWSKVDKTAGPENCWPWLGGHSKRDGYPWFYYKTVRLRARRMAWFYSHEMQPLSASLDVFARCTTRDCCNPAHLTVNPRESSTHGTGLPPALTREQAAEARRLHEQEAWGYQRLAIHFGVSKSTMYKLLNYQTYRTDLDGQAPSVQRDLEIDQDVDIFYERS